MDATIKLDHAVNLPPHPAVTELTVRRPKVKDELAAKRNRTDPAEIEVALLASLTGQSPAVIGELDLDDYDKLVRVLQDFRKKPGDGTSAGAGASSGSDASGWPGSAST